MCCALGAAVAVAAHRVLTVLSVAWSSASSSLIAPPRLHPPCRVSSFACVRLPIRSRLALHHAPRARIRIGAARTQQRQLQRQRQQQQPCGRSHTRSQRRQRAGVTSHERGVKERGRTAMYEQQDSTAATDAQVLCWRRTLAFLPAVAHMRFLCMRGTCVLCCCDCSPPCWWNDAARR